MLPRISKIIAVIISVGALSACGTVDEIFKSDSTSDIQVVNKGDAMSPPTMSPMEPMTQTSRVPQPAPGQPYAGNFDPNNLMSVYNQISRGGVQMYDPSQSGAMPMGGGSSYSGGVPAPQDSRVTVFPIEGGYLAAMQNYSGGTPPAGGSSSYGQPAYPNGNAQIFFKHGSSRLGSGDERKLEEVAEQARFSPVDRISVEGHASRRANTGDPVRDRIVNLKQSMDRTYAVSRSLMLKGVPAEKIRSTSWGDTRLSEDAPEDQTRRVDIYTGGAPRY